MGTNKIKDRDLKAIRTNNLASCLDFVSSKDPKYFVKSWSDLPAVEASELSSEWASRSAVGGEPSKRTG